ncbi:hypothetical protein BDR26DRAFT_1014101 [Obelidium mucronatum]|nr:hypothetical protein BDR26DRAFT_1014101 [Obelidium mucronatum]
MELFYLAALADEHDNQPPTTQQQPDQQQSHSISISLNLRYSASDGKFFDDVFPLELQGIIPSETFTSRIDGINKGLLKQGRRLEDYGPPTRASILTVYIIFCIVIILLSFKIQFSAMALWASMFFGLVGTGFVMVSTYYFKGGVRFIETELTRFNFLDTPIHLHWHSTREGHENVYSMDFSRKAAQVPWTIVITHRLNNGGDAIGVGGESEFLPAYCNDHHAVDIPLPRSRRGSVHSERAPSYKSAR